MAFTPFLQGTKAQGIIDNYLNNTAGGFPPFPSPSTNPYIVDSTPFIPPAAQPSPETPGVNTPNCDELYPGEGRVYDPVLQACVLPEMSVEESSGNNETPTADELRFNQMKRDNSTIFGASNTLDDYLIDTKGGDDILLRFDPSVGAPPPIFGLGLLDTLFGGNKRREDRFNQAMQTYTDSGYGQQRDDGIFQIFTPQQYYNTVQSNPLQGQNTSGGASTMTVGQAVDSVMNPTPQVYDPLTGTSRNTTTSSSGSPISEDLTGSLLGTAPLTTVDSKGNRQRNDTAYRAGVARNIERNKRNFGTSGFKEGVGFTRGR